MNLPEHKAGLSLEHNMHRNYYLTLEQWEDQVAGGLDWISPEQREKAIKEDSCWVIQWYPLTPVGFNRLAACDIEVLLEAANTYTHITNYS